MRDATLSSEGMSVGMKTIRWCLVALTAAVIGANGVGQAAEPLSKDQVTRRVTGKTLTWHSERLTNGERPRIKFGGDGEYSMTHVGAGNEGAVEFGTWHVTDKGQLCVTARGKSQGKCFYLIPTGGDSYMLKEELATSTAGPRAASQ
jgi:hypothetical protein